MKAFLIILVVILFATGSIVYFRAEKAFQSYLKTATPSDFKIPVNTKAKVLAKKELLIQAPPDRVWNVLSNFNQWPTWQRDVTEVNFSGKVEPETEFTWRAGGISFHSKLHTATPIYYLGWTGTTFGANAVHNWRLIEKEGNTLVQVEESLEGFLPILLGGYFQRNLEDGMQKNLMELKEEAEKKF